MKTTDDPATIAKVRRMLLNLPTPTNPIFVRDDSEFFTAPPPRPLTWTPPVGPPEPKKRSLLSLLRDMFDL